MPCQTSASATTTTSARSSSASTWTRAARSTYSNPGDDPDAHVRGSRAAAGAELLAKYDADGSGKMWTSGEFQALLQDYESPYDIWIEQTQEELGLVLRNRKDGHVCIVNIRVPRIVPGAVRGRAAGLHGARPPHRVDRRSTI